MKHRVLIIESERGWGQKVEDIKYFITKAEAMEFIAEFNKVNTEDSAPDWYMTAIYDGVAT